MDFREDFKSQLNRGPGLSLQSSNLDTVFELGPRHVRAQVLPRPRSPRYYDFHARSATARARGGRRISGDGARRTAGVEEASSVCTRGRRLWRHV